MAVRYGRRSFVKHCSLLGTITAATGCSRAAWKAAGSSRGPLRIVFYTDVHARPEGGVPDALTKAAERINSKGGDLIIGGGDLITGGYSSSPAAAAPRWDAYMDMHREIAGEHHTVIGNHDLVGVRPSDGSSPLADPRSSYRRRLGVSQTFHTFDAMGYRIILLDSLRISGGEYDYHGWVSEEQQEWLKEELSRISRTTPIVLALHIPLVTAFFGATEGATFAAKPNRVVVNNVEVLDLFRDHNLMVVLQGHLHVCEYLRWKNTTFITGGAVSGGWWKGPFQGTGEGFNMVTLRSDRVECEYASYR